MKRSEVNRLIVAAQKCFADHGWSLPPDPRWDVTDFGLGDLAKFGLVLVNLAEEAEYCEKLIYAQKGMVTPAHKHIVKKEDIIARWGTLRVQLWQNDPQDVSSKVRVKVNRQAREIEFGDYVDLTAGERITLVPGVVHSFEPGTDECIIGEVSTANDDAHDNIFSDPAVGRFSTIVEDEPALVRLVTDR